MIYDQILDTVNARSSYAGKYGWSAYGDASIFDLGDEGQQIASAVVANDAVSMFDCSVREVTIDIPDQQLAYRWRDPAYIKKHNKEAKARNVDNTIAWDNVCWVEIDSENEILALLDNYVGMVAHARAHAARPRANPAATSTERFTVKVDQRYVLEIQAESMDSARELATQWMDSLQRNWAPDDKVIFMDNYTVKESVEIERE